MSPILQQIKELEKTLMCTVCDEIFEHPVLIIECGHTFCKACVYQQTCTTCPTCKLPINHSNKQDDGQISEMIHLIQELKDLLKNELLKPNIDLAGNDDLMEIAETPMEQNSNCEKSKPALKPNKNLTMRTPRTQREQKKKFTSPAKYSPIHRANSSVRKAIKNSPKSGFEKRNFKGETQLHIAVIKGDIQRVKECLKNKANPNTKDNAGWTPLHEASHHGYLEIAKILLDHGAIVNVPGENNLMPLHDAILNGKIELAAYLISRGADTETKTSDGCTAFDLCTTDTAKKLISDAKTQFLSKDKDDCVSEKVNLRNKTKVVILSTSLEDDQNEVLVKCAKVMKAELVDEFTNEVTHVVTSSNESGHCNRTLKILQAIVTGKWIVNFDWITMCLEYKKKVCEEPFEISGTKHQPNTNAPKLARENAMNQFPPLFDGCNFYLSGVFTPPMPSKEELCAIIKLAGGKILTREPREDTMTFDCKLIPFHAGDGPFQKISHFILYQDKLSELKKSPYIWSVSVMWIIQSICAFRLLEVDI